MTTNNFSMKWTFTQKQIPKQNETFNLFSVNKFLYSMFKIQGSIF